jgi:triosephosphate isomerase
MSTKVLIINYKAYKEAFSKGLDIATYAKQVSTETNVEVIVAPPFTMLSETNKIAKTIAQGVDEVDPGAFTAHITWFELKAVGVSGTLLNHSEERYAYSRGGPLDYDKIKEAVDKCKAAGLETYVCVQNTQEAEEIAKINPTGIAYEPPELIGGDISVANSKPDIVKEFCEVVKKSSSCLALIGAGIKGKEDAIKSVELGSDGLLVASGILKEENYKAVIDELVSGLSQ